MNTQQEHELAGKVAKLLNLSAAQIDAPMVSKLLEARKEALAHFQGGMQKAPTRTWVPQWATGNVGGNGSGFGHGMFEPFSHNMLGWVVLLAFLTCLAGTVAWHTFGHFGQQGSEIADIDEGLLTDELPINAYLDKGFESWSKKPSR